VTRVRIDRLGRMSRQEWKWRTAEVRHRIAERIHVRVGAARWNRADIRKVLSTSERHGSAEAIDRSDWAAVQRTLISHMTERRTRFVLDPARAPAMRGTVLGQWPAALASATGHADRVMQGRFDLLGYKGIPCARDGRIDWHADPVHGRCAPRVFYADVPFLDPRIGDHKIIWELNRHQHWLLLGRAAWLSGDARYAREILVELNDWLAENPPLVGVNWASMLEIGFRTLSWTSALHFLLGQRRLGRWDVAVESSPWLIDMLIAIDRQLTHVEHHLSYYFSPNTHLTGEALALYVVGTALPELSGSDRWINTGRSVLLTEIDRQILPDGGHVERSTHYQRYTLDFYLLATLTARLAGDVDAARRFENATSRLADFTLTLADPNGVLPLLGDDDGGMLWPITGRACNDVRDSLALAAVVLQRPELAPWGVPEEVAWLAGPEAIRFRTATDVSSTSRLLADTGYFAARGADGSHAVVDVGSHGYLNGGHAHADALSLTLSIDGRAVLIDPGTSTYTMDPQLRDQMRSSISHNTVTLNDRSQSVPAGPFHWRSTVDARPAGWRTNPAFDWIEAAHDGYAPARHRRTVVRTLDWGWLVVDVIDGDVDRIGAAAHWHFDPIWHVTVARDHVRAKDANGNGMWMLCSGGDVSAVRGDSMRGGWCAPVYGQLLPTYTVRLATTADAPVTLVTWIGEGRRFVAPRMRHVGRATSGDDAVIVEIADGSRTALFMVRPAASADSRRMRRVGEFETDATMLHYATENGRLRAVSAVDARHVNAARDRWLSLTADAVIRDLHVGLGDDEIDFCSGEPPRRLVARGILRFPIARFNGRDLPLSAKPATDSLLIHGSDWRPVSAGKPCPSAVAASGAAFARH